MIKNFLKLTGTFVVEHWRNGVKIAEYTILNAITIEGKNSLLDVTFRNQTESSLWYMGLIDLTGYTALDEDDTYNEIDQSGNAWDEFKDYNFGGDSTKRATWIPNAAATKAISNSGTPSIFDITSGGTVKGIFLCGEPTGGGATPANQGDHDPAGILWSAALFSTGDVTVASSDQLKVTYTIQT